MKEGGEKARQEEEIEATGWEEVEALASQAPVQYQELEEDSGESLLARGAFGNVDKASARELVRGYAERVDLQRLKELRLELNKDIQDGVEMVGKYFTELLGLGKEPEIRLGKLSEDLSGGCRMRGMDEADVVEVDIEKSKGSADEILLTLAHEFWHSHQHEMIKTLITDDKKLDEDERWRAAMYVYNRRNYIKSSDDIEGYREQILEFEARAFEAHMLVRIIDVDIAEEKRENEKFMAEHPEVYGEENLSGVEEEVSGVLRGFDVEEFLGKVGVKSLDELFDMDKNDEVAKGHVEAVSSLVGLRRSVGADFIGKMKDGAGAGGLIWKINKAIWKCRQLEKVRYEPEEERSKLYKLNFDNFVVANEENRERYERQLLVREREMFAQDLVDILDEQATEEEIAALSPGQWEEAEKERVETGWRPVVSEKYEVRSKYAREN